MRVQFAIVKKQKIPNYMFDALYISQKFLGYNSIHYVISHCQSSAFTL